MCVLVTRTRLADLVRTPSAFKREQAISLIPGTTYPSSVYRASGAFCTFAALSPIPCSLVAHALVLSTRQSRESNVPFFWRELKARWGRLRIES